MAQKPSIPKGTRDFSPEEMVKRNYIFDTVKSVFKLFGFQQIETPAMENLSTLMGKYGEEGDKLLFKILNSGDFIDHLVDISLDLQNFHNRVQSIYENGELAISENQLIDIASRTIKNKNFKEYLLKKAKNIADYAKDKSQNFDEFEKYFNHHRKPQIKLLVNYTSKEFTKEISEKGLRYDLTVPFARYIVQYQSEINFPFRRYQIQPVWRADRPQKGRYREFYQCDVDVIGSDSLLSEAELVQIVDQVYQKLGIKVVLKINNRKILAGIAETIGEADRIVDITVAIDKLDKIGLEKVNEELFDKGVSQTAIEKLQPILLLTGKNEEKLNLIENVISGSEIGMKGIEEMRTIFGYIEGIGVQTEVELDLTLARGLNYYTGAIFEVKAKDVQIGSITGGGRYDDLTGIFGLPGISGVGISFGADRIYDVMTQLNLFPAGSEITTQVMFINFGKKEELYCLPILAKLRSAGISTEIFPSADKIKKQMNYANRKGIKYVVLAGETEIAEDLINLKNMVTGEQFKSPVSELIDHIKM